MANASPPDFKNITAKVGGAFTFLSESVATIKENVLSQTVRGQLCPLMTRNW
jgi:hypothetical protein